MEFLKIQLQSRTGGTTPPPPPHLEAGQIEGNHQSLPLEEFPAIGSNPAANRTPLIGRNTLQTPWKDKVSNPTTHSIGMPLKFVPPSLENGKPIVHIETQDVETLKKFWDRAVVLYVVGGNISANIIRGFIRKQWTHVLMPTIHEHEDGYFIIKFNSESECSEILKGGPYFLNRVPLVVKKWSANFDFKEEILRVIPVWVRLPSLPLHCWGVETLSRIVSAVGVPVLADEYTMTQRKVSYARVLVEIDITQEFVKEINVRDNTGNVFTQKAIPEWRPFFCRNCNKVGHDCKEHYEPRHQHGEQPRKDDKEANGEKIMWVPKTIANLVRGATTVEELRNKLTIVTPQEEVNLEKESHPPENTQNQNKNNNNNQEEDKEVGWTPVAPGKVARRHQPKATSSNPLSADIEAEKGNIGEYEDSDAHGFTYQERGGNPQISSPQ